MSFSSFSSNYFSGSVDECTRVSSFKTADCITPRSIAYGSIARDDRYSDDESSSPYTYRCEDLINSRTGVNFENSTSLDLLATSLPLHHDEVAATVSGFAQNIIQNCKDLDSQAPVRPELKAALDTLRQKLPPDFWTTRSNDLFYITLQQLFCTRQAFVVDISARMNLSLLKELSVLEDVSCKNKLTSLLKQPRRVRELEMECNRYRDVLLSCLRASGRAYHLARPDEKCEKRKQFVQDLVTILPCYSSSLICISSILGIDACVDAILKEARSLSSPFKRLQDYFIQCGWAKTTS